MAEKEIEGDLIAVDELLRELSELRELDRRRHAHAPGSSDHLRASFDVDRRSRRLMDRFRDLVQGGGVHRARETVMQPRLSRYN